MRRRSGTTGAAGGRLPRQRPAPEHNIIQKPELIRALQQRLGIRQAHVAPALNDGVQAVVVMDDLGRQRLEIGGESYAAGDSVVGDGIQFTTAIFNNALGTGVRARIISIVLQSRASSGNIITLTLGSGTAGTLSLSPVSSAFSDGSSEDSTGTPADPNTPKKSQPKCRLFLGRTASGLGVFLVPDLVVDLTDVTGTTIYEYRPKNRFIYPGQRFGIQANSSLALFGFFHVRVEWAEESHT